MTPEQQRIAIAEACGWYFMDDSWHYPNGANAITTPDYLNDLNAMHDAEETLDYNQMNRYQNIELSRFVHTETTWICSATAAERAEAFLRTLDLWTP